MDNSDFLRPPGASPRSVPSGSSSHNLASATQTPADVSLRLSSIESRLESFEGTMSRVTALLTKLEEADRRSSIASSVGHGHGQLGRVMSMNDDTFGAVATHGTFRRRRPPRTDVAAASKSGGGGGGVSLAQAGGNASMAFASQSFTPRVKATNKPPMPRTPRVRPERPEGTMTPNPGADARSTPSPAQGGLQTSSKASPTQAPLVVSPLLGPGRDVAAMSLENVTSFASEPDTSGVQLTLPATARTKVDAQQQSGSQRQGIRSASASQNLAELAGRAPEDSAVIPAMRKQRSIGGASMNRKLVIVEPSISAATTPEESGMSGATGGGAGSTLDRRGSSSALHPRHRRVSVNPNPLVMPSPNVPHRKDTITGASPLVPKSPTDGFGDTNATKMRRNRSQAGIARRESDEKEMSKLEQWLEQHPPVDSDRTFVYWSDAGYIIISLMLCCLAALGIFQDTGFEIEERPPIGLTIVVVLAQMYSAVWMVLRGGFVRKMIGDSHLLDTHEEIARHYLRTWFPLDLITTFPIELIFIGWLNPGFFYSMIRHILRFFRMASLVRSSNPLLPERPVLLFLVMTGVSFFIIACFAVLFQVLESEDNFTNALYWATATVTSTGYGDVNATSNRGRIFSVVGMLVSLAVVSLLQAYSTSLLTSRDVVKEEITRKKQTMYSMLQHFNIPWDVQKDVIFTFPAVLDAQREGNFKQMINDLPPLVTEKLEYFVKLHVVQSTAAVMSAFRRLSPEDSARATGLFADSITVRKLAPMEYFVQPGQPCTEAFIMTSGVAEIIRFTEEAEEVLHTLRRGMTLGTVCLDDGPSERVWAGIGAQALQMSEMYCIHKADYGMLMERMPLLDVPPCGEEAEWTRVEDESFLGPASGNAEDPFANLGSFNAMATDAAFAAKRGRRKSLGASLAKTASMASPSDGEIDEDDILESPRDPGLGHHGNEGPSTDTPPRGGQQLPTVDGIQRAESGSELTASSNTTPRTGARIVEVVGLANSSDSAPPVQVPTHAFMADEE